MALGQECKSNTFFVWTSRCDVLPCYAFVNIYSLNLLHIYWSQKTSLADLLSYICLQVDQYIHRILVEEDANTSQGSNSEMFEASADAGINLYKKGDLGRSQYSSVDVYLLRKVLEMHLLYSHIQQA